MTDYAVDFKYLLEPRSIAVIGASKDELKSGGMFISSMLKDNYPGRLFPINKKESEIMGLKCYPSVADVPGEIDLAILTVPARAINQSMRECAKKHVKFAIVHAVGFSELGAEGKELEKEMVRIARGGGVRVIGPNCMGIFSPRAHINTLTPHVRVALDPGGFGFVGQSGWVTEVAQRVGSSRGLRFSGAISIGNQSDLTIEDFIEYWGNDPQTKVIGVYIEGLKNPRLFFNLVKRITPHKPVIALKGGSSEIGASSALSHTGSLAGNFAIFNALCKQTGVTIASSVEDIIDFAIAFSSPVLPSGRDICLLIEAGGAAVAAADACAREKLNIKPLPPEAQLRLLELLKDKVPPSSNRRNPVDVVWAPMTDGAKLFGDCLEIILPTVDACMMLTYILYQEAMLRARLVELRDRYRKPIILVPGNPLDQILGMELAAREGLPSYSMPENAIKSLAAMIKRTEYLKNVSAA